MQAQILKLLGCGVLAVVLAGCAQNYGNSAIKDSQKVESIQVGKTTIKEVEAMFGRPSHVETESNGEQVWMYQNVNVSGTAMIPFAAMFTKTMKEDNVSVRFSKNGVVKMVGRGESTM